MNNTNNTSGASVLSQSERAALDGATATVFFGMTWGEWLPAALRDEAGPRLAYSHTHAFNAAIDTLREALTRRGLTWRA